MDLNRHVIKKAPKARNILTGGNTI